MATPIQGTSPVRPPTTVPATSAEVMKAAIRIDLPNEARGQVEPFREGLPFRFEKLGIAEQCQAFSQVQLSRNSRTASCRDSVSSTKEPRSDNPQARVGRFQFGRCRAIQRASLRRRCPDPWHKRDPASPNSSPLAPRPPSFLSRAESLDRRSPAGAPSGNGSASTVEVGGRIQPPAEREAPATEGYLLAKGEQAEHQKHSQGDCEQHGRQGAVEASLSEPGPAVRSFYARTALTAHELQP